MPLSLAAVEPTEGTPSRATLSEPSSFAVELWRDIKPQFGGRTLIKGMLPSNALALAFGAPGCGKSFVAVDAAAHVASGRDWFGKRTRQGPVVYIGAEGQEGLRARIEAWKREHDEGDIPFGLIPATLSLLQPGDVERVANAIATLAQVFGGIALIVVDTLSASFGAGDENGGDMAAYVAQVNRLRAPYKATALIVHHVPVGTDAKRPRGHGSLLGAVDAAFHLSGDSEAFSRRIRIAKQKDDAAGEDILFRLRPVEIGTDEDHEPVTSCVIEALGNDPAATSTGRPRPRLTANHEIVRVALERAIVAEGVAPPTSIPDDILNRLQSGKVVRIDAWRDRARSLLGQSSDTKPDTIYKNVVRATEALQAKGYAEVWQGWAWSL